MINYTGKIGGILNDLFNLDKDIVYDVKVSKHREKRSLNANSYAWKLITQIADEMRLSKEQVYLEMLETYGQSQMLPFKPGDTPKGWFKYYKFITRSKLNGKDAEWYKVIKGSSDYDSKEMSIFIDGIVQEAEQLGIPTIYEEVEKVKESWKNNE